ncbi:type II CAAX endopeptidase family protein [Cedecea neteri]|nr:type II CAAX endopeptidase family protein [Cedecea neteri]NIG76909.1 CPBP family intramembrane metalloprotease [Klebsiella sp. Ap-873]WNJ78836.1 type II CAAX endopeptidase family protein [Cedecea neteri]
MSQQKMLSVLFITYSHNDGFMLKNQDRLLHLLICIGAWIGWYALSIFATMLPGFTALFRSGMAIPALIICFWLPYTLIIWRHYQNHYGTLPLGKVTPSGLILPAIALFMLVIIQQFTGSPEPWMQSIEQLPVRSLVLVALTATLLAPILEEVIFRGFLLNAGEGYGKVGKNAAMLMASVLFAFSHSQYQNATTFISLFIFSVILCLARVYSGSLIVPIILHGLNNAISFSFLLLLDKPLQ